MSNPDPKTEHLKPYQAIALNNEPLAERPLTVRVPVEIDQMIRSLPDKSAWMRKVLVEAANRELSGKETSQI